MCEIDDDDDDIIETYKISDKWLSFNPSQKLFYD